jgi:hypothetical protein
MIKKLMMMVEYPPSEASAGGGSMRGAVAAAFGAWAETETVGDYTWTYRIDGDTAENVV